MRHVRRGARVGQKFPLIQRGPAAALIFDDFNGMPVGIGDEIILVADFSGRNSVRHLDAARREIVPHAVGVVGFQRDVIEPIRARFLLGEELDRLLVVDLDPREVQRAVRIRQRIRLAEAEKILVEGAGFLDVVNVQRDVRDPDDVRARRIVACARCRGRKNDNRDGENRSVNLDAIHPVDWSSSAARFPAAPGRGWR